MKKSARGASPARGGARSDRESTERVVGLAAARAVLEKRPHDVLNVAHSPEARYQVADLLRAAAAHRIAYRELPREELDRLAGTLHHEGVCLRVRARPPFGVLQLISAFERGGFGVVLDGVENPHNIGALLRSAAYFGARAMLVRGGGTRLVPAATRIAEGGAEHVPVCFVDDLREAIAALKRAQVAIVAADAHGGEPLHQFRWPERSVIVLGAERAGLSKAVLSQGTKRVHIPGTGRVESLNVSVAAGILMASAAAR